MKQNKIAVFPSRSQSRFLIVRKQDISLTTSRPCMTRQLKGEKK